MPRKLLQKPDGHAAASGIQHPASDEQILREPAKEARFTDPGRNPGKRHRGDGSRTIRVPSGTDAA